MALEPGVVVDHYRLDQVSHRGRVTTVFAATDLSLQRRVAFKVLGDTVYVWGSVGDALYYVTEFVNGLSLAELVQRQPGGEGLPVAETVDLPRQLAAAVDERADVYALACTAVEAFCGRPPFDGPDDEAVLAAHVQVPPPDITSFRRTLPSGFDAVFHRALAKQPSERYRTCTELVEAALTERPADAPPGSGAPPVPTQPR